MHRVLALVFLAACTEYSFKAAPPAMFPGATAVDTPDRAGLLGALSEPAGEGEAPLDDPPDDDPLGTADTTPEGATEEAGYTAEGTPDDQDPLGDDPLGDDPADEDPTDEDPLGDDPLGDDPPEGNMTPGRMTGSVQTSDDVRVKALVYCDVTWTPDFQIRVDGAEFDLLTLDVVTCWDDPDTDSGSGVTDFDTLIGEGRGTYDGLPATVWFTVSDGGEPAEQDHVAFEITVGGTVIAGDGYGDHGNLQAHPPVGGVP